MRESWRVLVDSVLRPSRPHLERCERERDQHLAARKLAGEERARAIADCEARIERARAEVFAAQDGVVGSRMTALEREWRTLARRDPDAGLMDLWARIAPPSWIDRKRWRDSSRDARLDAAIALAADPDGVEAAESAIEALRAALAAWGKPIGAQVRWCSFERDADVVTTLLEAPPAVGIVRERAEELERDVHEMARLRFPDRPGLVRDLAHAAFVAHLWRTAPASGRPDPVAPLRDLWKTGYGLASADASGVTLEIPAL